MAMRYLRLLLIMGAATFPFLATTAHAKPRACATLAASWWYWEGVADQAIRDGNIDAWVVARQTQAAIEATEGAIGCA